MWLQMCDANLFVGGFKTPTFLLADLFACVCRLHEVEPPQPDTVSMNSVQVAPSLVTSNQTFCPGIHFKSRKFQSLVFLT